MIDPAQSGKSGCAVPDKWYHSFRLPDGGAVAGEHSLPHLEMRFELLGIPNDLNGKRALDIGAWDGWFSFEMERRGADVVAIDNTERTNFLHARRMLDSKVEYKILDIVHDTDRLSELGQFDIVLFLGVLYHVKHPLLALERVCSLTRETAIVESCVLDGSPGDEPDLPGLRFYEYDELRGHSDNWFVPNTTCLLGLCRTAGFADVQLAGKYDERAVVRCSRFFSKTANFARPGPKLLDVRHFRNYGINFSQNAGDYLTLWLTASDRAAIQRKDVFVTVGAYDAPTLWAGRADGCWQVNAILPPGLKAGWHQVRCRLSGTDYSAPLEIAVDVPLDCDGMEIFTVCDSSTWTVGSAGGTAGSNLSFYVSGLPKNADCNNVGASWGRRQLMIEYVGPLRKDGLRQINAVVAQDIPSGPHPFWVTCGSHRSKSKLVVAKHNS